MSDSGWLPSATGARDTYTQRAANQATVAPSASDQWLRRIDLTVYDSPSDSGSAINLTPDGDVQLQVIFQVRKMTNESPNLLTARIFNLAPDTMVKVIEQRRVVLRAGYKTGRFGIIFKGNVAQYRRGKENATDTYLEIIAGDADLAFGYDAVTQGWQAGEKVGKVISDHVDGMVAANPNLSRGVVEPGDYGNAQLIRSYAQNRTRHMSMRDLMNGAQADWFIDDEKVNFLDRTKYIDGAVAILSPATGLVGMPEVTPQGIQARCLLNPNLRLGGLVRIDTDLLSGVPFIPGTQTQLPNAGPTSTGDTRVSPATGKMEFSSAFTSPTGTYKILLLEHAGETRGNPWYSELVCIALDLSGGAIPNRDMAYGRTIVAPIPTPNNTPTTGSTADVTTPPAPTPGVP